jgi:hypothetical protein
LLIGVAFFMSQGLRAQQVHYNFMSGTDFSKYHTYKWVEIPGGIHPNQIIDQEIRQAVNNTLASKGLTLATGDTADVYVAISAPWIRRNSGMRGAPEVDSWAEWPQLQALRSPTGHWRLISTIPRRNNSSGAALRPRP